MASFSRLVRIFSLRRPLPLGSPAYSTGPGEAPPPGEASPDTTVVMTRDRSTLVCWHPPRDFPYEHTRPLPVGAPATHPTMRVQALQPVKEIFRPMPEQHARLQLQRLTYTSKHRWFPPGKRKLKHKDTQRDREYL